MDGYPDHHLDVTRDHDREARLDRCSPAVQYLMGRRPAMHELLVRTLGPACALCGDHLGADELPYLTVHGDLAHQWCVEDDDAAEAS